MKLRLISDGTRGGTFIVDDATNEPVENVESIDWHFGLDSDSAIGVIRIKKMGADLSGEIRRLLD